MSNEEVVKSVWDSTTSHRAQDIHHQCSIGVEAVMRDALMKKTLDNITVVMVCLSGFKRATFPKEKDRLIEPIKNSNVSLSHLDKLTSPSYSNANYKKTVSIDTDKFDKKYDLRIDGLVTTKVASKLENRPLYSAFEKRREVSGDFMRELSSSTLSTKASGSYTKLYK